MPIFIIVSVSPLNELYSKANGAEPIDNLNENRWKIFGWIMSIINDETISVI